MTPSFWSLVSRLSWLSCTWFGLTTVAVFADATAPLAAGTGILVGEVTANSALVQVRLSAGDKLVDGDLPGAAGIVAFSVAAASTEEAIVFRQTASASAARDFIARAAVTGLSPGTRYVCRTRIGPDEAHLQAGPVATFQTLFGPAVSAPARFVVVTGMNYAKFHGDPRIDRKLHVKQNNIELAPPYSGPDKQLGYPALRTILALRPLFFVGTGDNVYYDTPTDPRAQTRDEMRRKWHEQFVQPRYRDLFAAVPTYWEIDDHDFRKDDCDNTGNYQPTPELGQAVMLEQLPYATSDDPAPRTFRTHRVSRELQVWLTENRWFRSPNSQPDGPDKTIWGAEQKAWLKRTLADSDAAFKVLISPTPLVGPDDLRKTDNHADVGGFQHERDEFFAWLKTTGVADRGFAIVCGDRHWQYHSVHPTGIEEFSCGALVDENGRLGRQPGDPQSTDPDAKIRQPYCQAKVSGGFLLIESQPPRDGQPARVTFQFCDEHGVVLNEHAQTAR